MHIVGIVGRSYYNKDGQEIVQTHDAIRRFLNKREDVVCITLLSPEEECLTNLEQGEDKVDERIDYLLDKCDAFVVPGGTYAYHFDEYVINYAIEHDKPLLAICLGFQVLCSMFSKNRTRFDMTERLNLERHTGKGNEYSHDVLIKNNTKLKEILNIDRMPVNSVHHDIVNFDIDSLVVNAISDDGVLEGVEYPNKKFIIGLQWHPEYLVDENSLKILNSFIK
jgi:gamma-glutamyl-gamma-aminobutyrate hydrolase PuuD